MFLTSLVIASILVMLGLAWGHNGGTNYDLLPLEKKIEQIELRRTHDKHCGSDQPNYVQACNKMYDDFIQELIDKENGKNK